MIKYYREFIKMDGHLQQENKKNPRCLHYNHSAQPEVKDTEKIQIIIYDSFDAYKIKVS